MLPMAVTKPNHEGRNSLSQKRTSRNKTEQFASARQLEMEKQRYHCTANLVAVNCHSASCLHIQGLEVQDFQSASHHLAAFESLHQDACQRSSTAASIDGERPCPSTDENTPCIK